MRTFWFFIAVLVIAGAIVAFLSESPGPDVPNATSDLAGELASELAASSEARAEARAEDVVPEEPTPATSEQSTITAGLDVTIPHATVIPGDIHVIDGDRLSVDETFTLSGQGTQESPFEPSWDYLFSAADTYQPRLGERDIPQRIALLDGKWVRIAGYTAFPLIVGETSEMLVMLNKWDGCCIGVPPTPFDAVEVRLTSPVQRGPKHQINYGTVTGRLKVDPYLIEDWLVGLYILEESSLSTDL